MQDRPTYSELLKAVERFLDEEVVPNAEGTRKFHARVAANVLRIVTRELEGEDEQLSAECERLDDLLGASERPASRTALREAIRMRTEELCRRIREGEADAGPYRERVVDHLRTTVREKLRVSDPAWLGRDEAPEGEAAP
ncbi:MAG: hypothetical protein HYS09_06640 [Chloroflexi bacterium]|nr:hypothetical protein [Chloroflexota bacterium]